MDAPVHLPESRTATLSRPATLSRTVARSARRTTFEKVFVSLFAVLCAVLLIPGSPAWANGDTDGGPGKWGPPAPGGAKPGSLAAAYELQLPGKRPGQEYWVPFPETRAKPGFGIKTWVPNQKEGFPFDSWDRQGKTLLDAKGQRYAYLLDPKNAHWSKAKDGLIKEAGRAARAASGTSATVKWHWAETDANQRMTRDLRRYGITSTFTEPKKPAVFSAPGSPADPKGVGRQGGAAIGARPGGIDFSTLQLRHLSATSEGGSPGVKYSFKNAIGPDTGDPDVAREASDAFFVWMSLDPSQFWVNLNPDQPDRIMDRALARTHVGKVLLEADLQLKKTMSDAMDPETKTGKRYWDRMFHGPDDDVCAWTRFWITPKPASVRTSGEDLYILDAGLNVSAQTGDPGSNSCPGQTEERRKYNEKVFREVLLPEMERSVNSDAVYADLRRVYLSRVAAEWYRQVSRSRDTMFKGLIGQGIVGPWVLREPWDPKDVFEEYKRLINSNRKKVVIDGREYEVVYGGVDFSKAPSVPMPEDEFKTKHPTLPKTVDKSVEEPARDADGEHTWLGGTSIVDREKPKPPTTKPPTTAPGTNPGTTPATTPGGHAGGLPNTGTSLWLPVLAGLLLCIVGGVLLVLARRGRAGRRTPDVT